MVAETKPFVGIFAEKGSCMCDKVMKALVHMEIPFRTLDRDGLATVKPADLDVLLFPGGRYRFLGPLIDNVRAFVKSGGGYVGICCGLYNAIWLGLLDAEPLDVRGLGPHQLEIRDGTHPIMAGVAKKDEAQPWRDYEQITMIRLNGPFLKVGKDVHIIASYDINGSLGAIVASEYGGGRVVGFSPHPEGVDFDEVRFKDRDDQILIYDGIQMGTVKLLENALIFAGKKG